MFSNVSIPFQMDPIVSKYIQKFNLTFKAPNKDNTRAGKPVLQTGFFYLP